MAPLSLKMSNVPFTKRINPIPPSGGDREHGGHASIPGPGPWILASFTSHLDPKFMPVTPLFFLLSPTCHFAYLIKYSLTWTGWVIKLTTVPLPPSGLLHTLWIIQNSLPWDLAPSIIRNHLFFSLSLKITSWREHVSFYIIYIPEFHNNNSYHCIIG